MILQPQERGGQLDWSDMLTASEGGYMQELLSASSMAAKAAVTRARNSRLDAGAMTSLEVQETELYVR